MRNRELESTKLSGRVRSHKLVLSSKDKDISLAEGRFSFAYKLWVDSKTLDLECPSVWISRAITAMLAPLTRKWQPSLRSMHPFHFSFGSLSQHHHARSPSNLL